MTRARSRKDTAKAFLRLAATGKVREAYERFVAAGFRHHNPYFRGDAESLRAGMEEAHAKFPQTAIEIQRALATDAAAARCSRPHRDPAELSSPCSDCAPWRSARPGHAPGRCR